MANTGLWLEGLGTHVDFRTIDFRRQGRDIESQEYAAVDIELAELESFAEAIAGHELYPVIPVQAVHGIAVFQAVVKSVERDGDRVEVPGTQEMIG